MEKPIDIWSLTRTLLRKALTGADLPDGMTELLTDDVLQNILHLSSRYDVAHLVACALPELHGETAAFEKAKLKAFMRCEQQSYEFERLSDVLEQAKIPYLPLKGVEIRSYYPEPWMRTGCDIDVMLHEDDLDRAITLLLPALQAKPCGRTPHDVSIETAGGVHIELHYRGFEQNRSGKAGEVLQDIWVHAHSVSGGMRYALDGETFYLYHIAHMAKHFEVGGCGVRPFLDLWLLDKKLRMERERAAELLRKSGLLKFAQTCSVLARVWLEDEPHTELTAALERYILHGGMYGNISNMVAVQQTKNGGKLRYIRYRLFLPYDSIKNQYPVLKKHKWLTPVMQVRRWVKMVTDGRMHRTASELRSLREDTGGQKQVEALMRQLEL